MTTRNDVRKAFKEIGYKVSFKRNPFNDTLCNLGFQSADMLKPIVVAASNCYSVETYSIHEQAFALACSYKGTKLTDTDQKIV